MWHVMSHVYHVRAQVLGEALLASGYIAYLGPAPGLFRIQVDAETSQTKLRV